MIRWTLDRIARVVGGTLHGDSASVRGVSVDTRTLDSGALFVAIRGERFDGHDYLDSAFERGQAAC